MHQGVLGLAAAVSIAVVAGACDVQEATSPAEQRSVTPAGDEGQADGPQAIGCGCAAPDRAALSEMCWEGLAGETREGVEVLLSAECQLAEAPWCDAQIGCTYGTQTCVCEPIEEGFYSWVCDDDADSEFTESCIIGGIAD